MFKIPEWDDSVPESKATFIRKDKEKLKKSTDTNRKPSSLKVNHVKEQNNHSTSTRHHNNTSKKRKHGNEETKKNKVKKTDTSLQNKNEDTPTGTKIKINKDSDSKTFLGANFDEILLNARKKKFNKVFEDEDKEDILFTENKHATIKKNTNGNSINNNKKDLIRSMYEEVKPDSSKLRLKAIIDSKNNRNHIDVSKSSNKLRERMLERLKAAQFRYLNEKLYTSTGSDAQQLFQSDPEAFQTYHQGYQLQVKKWPVNPLDLIVKRIMKMPKSHTIADMGCGEAALSKRIPHNVRSFDLVASAPGVEACDMARTPLLTASVDVTVYCLALMGTDLTQYLLEANRVLKMGGHLLIAEVESRFDKVENFSKEVERLGFKLKQLDKSNNVFFFMEFIKVRDPPVKKAKLPLLTLKPCLYKRR